MLSESRLRPALAAAGLLLGALALLLYREDQARRDTARRLLPHGGEAAALHEIERLLAWSDDEGMASVAAARTALGRALDGGDRRTAVERLRAIEGVCLRLLGERPAFAAAAATLGRARFLRLTLDGDPALWREPATWRAPLEHAIAAAPADPEPRRLLAQGLLSIWYSLSSRDRAEGREAIRRALEDPATLQQLGGTWFEQAASPMEALALFPDHPAAWTMAARLAGEAADWPAWLEARRRGQAAARRDVERGLATGERMVAAGRAEGARGALLAAFAASTADASLAGAVDRILKTLPPGAVLQADRDRRREWLDWSLQRSLHGLPGLSAPAVDRLAQASRDLDPGRQALAALASDRLAAAEALQRRAAVLDAAWGPYLISKARHLAGRARLPEAHATYELVPADWRGTPIDHAVGRSLGQAAADRLRQLPRAPRWESVAGSGAQRLAFYLDSTARSLTLGAQGVPPEGAVVEWSVDGEAQPPAVLRGASITLPLAIEAGAHWIDVRPAGRAFRPAGASVLTPRGPIDLVPFLER